MNQCMNDLYGDEMERVFTKYYRRRRVENQGVEMLDDLYDASFVDYVYVGDELFVEAS